MSLVLHFITGQVILKPDSRCLVLDSGCTGESLLGDPHKKCRAAFPHASAAPIVCFNPKGEVSGRLPWDGTHGSAALWRRAGERGGSGEQQ